MSGRKAIKRRGQWEVHDEFTGELRPATKEELGRINVRLNLDDPTSAKQVTDNLAAIPQAIKLGMASQQRVEAKEAARQSRQREMRNMQIQEMASTAPSLAMSGVEGAVDRVKVKNLAMQPALARAYFINKGYEVIDIPTQGILDPGFNFLVRKNKNETHRVLDPRTGVISSDIIFDILDLAADTVEGVFTAKATVAGTILGTAVGGPTGGVLGGAGVGGAAATMAEGFRQGLGQAVGIPQVPNLADAAQYGVMAALAPAAAEQSAKAMYGLVKLGADTGGDLFLEYGSRLSGARKFGGVAAKDIFRMRAKDPAGVTEKIPGFATITDDILDALRIAGDPEVAPFPERIAATNILKEVPDDVTVNLSQQLDGLRALARFAGESLGNVGAMGSPERKALQQAAKISVKSSTAPGQAAELLDRIEVLLSLHNIDPKKAPIMFAEEFKRVVQSAAFVKGAFKGAPMEKPLAKVLTDIQHSLRADIEGLADKSGIVTTDGFTYSQLMGKVADRTRAINSLSEVVHLGDDPTKQAQRLETYLAGAFGTRRSTTMDGLRWLEEQTGIKLIGPARRAMLNIAFGDEGAAEVAPKLSPMGNVLGATLLGAGGAAVAGPKGALAAPAAGALAASPRNILRLTRGALKIQTAAQQATERFSRGIPPMVADAASLTARTGASMAGREGARRKNER